MDGAAVGARLAICTARIGACGGVVLSHCLGTLVWVLGIARDVREQFLLRHVDRELGAALTLHSCGRAAASALC